MPQVGELDNAAGAGRCGAMGSVPQRRLPSKLVPPLDRPTEQLPHPPNHSSNLATRSPPSSTAAPPHRRPCVRVFLVLLNPITPSPHRRRSSTRPAGRPRGRLLILASYRPRERLTNDPNRRGSEFTKLKQTREPRTWGACAPHLDENCGTHNDYSA
jgi:hypothetical protein